MIRLVGPGGAGKSTVGALLARRLRVAFIDLDEEFATNVGDISVYLDTRGYDAYAARNVDVYLAFLAEPRPEMVLSLSSGFMSYRPDIHPGYERCRREIASNPSTFVLLQSFDLETCVAETVRRQLTRPFTRSPQREAEVIRARFPIYFDIPARKAETMRPAEDVVDELVEARPGHALAAELISQRSGGKT